MLPDDVWVRIIALLGDQGGSCACLSKAFIRITQNVRKMALYRALQATNDPLPLMATDADRYPEIALENDGRFRAYLDVHVKCGPNSTILWFDPVLFPNAWFLNAFMWTWLFAWLKANYRYVKEFYIRVANAPPFPFEKRLRVEQFDQRAIMLFEKGERPLQESHIRLYAF
jgi:hypothetical protein